MTVQAGSYSELSIIQLARKIYVPEKHKSTAKEELDLNRYLASGFQKHSNFPGVVNLMSEIKNYRTLLKRMGIEDYQVLKAQRRPWRDSISLLHSILKTLGCLTFVFDYAIFPKALPGLLLNLPLALLLRYYSESERRKALKNSKVKVLGKDVVASYKMLASLIIMPISNVIFTFLFWYLIRNRTLYKRFGKKLIVMFFFMWPIYASCKNIV